MIQRKYYKTVRVIIDSDGGGTPLYIENVDAVPGYFTLKKSGTLTYTPNLNYRIDNGEWFEYDVVNMPRIEVPVGSKIYLKGNNANGFNQNSGSYVYYYCFKLYSSSTSTTSYCKCNIGGYITSLLALENFNLISNIPNYGLRYLFYENTNLLSAENLITNNITSVGYFGLASCFGGCTSLVTAPTFENVTTILGYSFSGCFGSCTSLVTAPKFDKITSVGGNSFDSCFGGCTSLVTAPTFENVIGVNNSGLASCFKGCTSLVTAPKFDKITSVGGNSFRYCFQNCTSLGTIIAPQPSSWDVSNFNSWVSGVPTGGTFYKKKGLEIPTGTNGIPEGWTVVEEA